MNLISFGINGDTGRLLWEVTEQSNQKFAVVNMLSEETKRGGKEGGCGNQEMADDLNVHICISIYIYIYIYIYIHTHTHTGGIKTSVPCRRFAACKRSLMV